LSQREEYRDNSRIERTGLEVVLPQETTVKDDMLAAEYAVSDACTLFNVSSDVYVSSRPLKFGPFPQIDSQLTAAAREIDRRDLINRLDVLAQNDQDVLNAL
jgi:hypothetical protein